MPSQAVCSTKGGKSVQQDRLNRMIMAGSVLPLDDSALKGSDFAGVQVCIGCMAEDGECDNHQLLLVGWSPLGAGNVKIGGYVTRNICAISIKACLILALGEHCY